MEFKTHRYILTALWGLLFVMNSIIYIHYKTPMALFMAGYSLGMGLMQLMFNPFVNSQDKLIQIQKELIYGLNKKK